jgi:transcriptional regulator with XRE-family HTH domain
MSGSNGDKRELVRNLDREFGERMRRQRERQGAPQQHVALTLEAMYGIRWHQTTVGKVESGERGIRLTEAVAVAQTLGVSLDELVYGDADTERKRERLERAASELLGVRHQIDKRLGRLRFELRIDDTEADESDGE